MGEEQNYFMSQVIANTGLVIAYLGCSIRVRYASISKRCLQLAEDTAAYLENRFRTTPYAPEARGLAEKLRGTITNVSGGGFIVR